MDKLWRVAMQLCKYNREDANDLLQDSMLRAYRGREALAQADNPYAWLRRVLVNTFLNSVRDSKRWRELVELEESHAAEAESYDTTPSLLIDAIRRDVLNDELLAAIDSLPELTRTLFLLSDVEAFTHVELATMFGMPKGTVSARVFRGRKQLATMLEAWAVQQGHISSGAVAAEREEARMASEHCPDRARQEAALLASTLSTIPERESTRS